MYFALHTTWVTVHCHCFVHGSTRVPLKIHGKLQLKIHCSAKNFEIHAWFFSCYPFSMSFLETFYMHGSKFS